MKDMDCCFICLINTTERICDTCKCYAHKKCFYQYIKNNSRVFANITKIHNYLELDIGNKLDCPVCKNELNYVKRLTRNDTYMFRIECIIYVLNHYLKQINDVEDMNTMENILENICKIIIEHKTTIKGDKRILPIIKKLLKVSMCPSANLYHFEIFGEQIYS